jgi:hypothetical protein
LWHVNADTLPAFATLWPQRCPTDPTDLTDQTEW